MNSLPLMLRGSLNDLPRFLQTTRRELQNNPVESTSSDGSGSNAFLWFASVVVGLICCCYIYCMYQVIRFWCCRRPNPLEISQTVLVHEGYVFNLNPRQRRAVLEAIFSETSKSVTATSQLDNELKDLEAADIPAIHTLETKDGHDSEDDDQYVPCTLNSPANPITPSKSDESLAKENQTELVSLEVVDFSTVRAISNDVEKSGISISVATETTKIRKSFPWQKKPCRHAKLAALGIPALNDGECKEEVETNVVSLKPSNFAKNDMNIAALPVDSIDTDDDTDENVCSICLSGYQEGDVVVSSKYCMHLFHKDCILEWLENHDICPCCRVDMVTDGDVSKAATSIVGKTRMIKAVQSIHTVTATPPASPTTRMGRQSPRVRRMGGGNRWD